MQPSSGKWITFFLIFWASLAFMPAHALTIPEQIDAIIVLGKTEPRKGIEAAQALWQQIEPDDWDNLHRLNNEIAFRYVIMSEFEPAMAQLNTWLQLVPANRQDLTTRTYEVMATIALRTGQAMEANDRLHQAMTLAEQFSQYNRMVSVRINISIFLRAMGQLDLALEEIDTAIQLSEQYGLPQLHIIAANNKAAILHAHNRYQESNQILQELQQHPDFHTDDLAYTQLMQARNYLALNELSKAEFYALSALPVYTQREDTTYLARIDLVLAAVALSRHETKNAQLALERAFARMETSPLHELFEDAFLLQSLLSEQLSDYEGALSSLKEHIKRFQSYSYRQAQEQLMFMRSQAERIEDEQHIIRLNNELSLHTIAASHHSQMQKMTIAFMMLVLIISYWFLRLQHKKRIEADQLKNALQQSYLQLQETQSRLIESEQLASISGWVAGIAHEMNTPLGILTTSMSAMTDQLQSIRSKQNQLTLTRTDLESWLNSGHAGAELCHKNLDRCQSLIEHFDLISRPHNVQRTLFALSDVIEEITQSLKEQLENIHCKFVSNDVFLFSDKQLVGMILRELIMNSLAYAFDQSNDSPCISIHASKQSNKTHIQYQDNGKGLPKEFSNKVFEPFITTNRYQGHTGLGLNLIYNLTTKSLQGELQLDQTKPGFSLHITLPDLVKLATDNTVSTTSTNCAGAP